MKKKYIKAKIKAEPSRLEKLARILLIGSFLSFLIATFITGFPILAFAWNILSPKTSEQLSKILSTPINLEKRIEKDNNIKEIEKKYKLPEKDLSLPLESKIEIEKIGVETIILEKPLEQYEEALKNGVWRVPNFGTPTDRTNPIILVGHRFGYISWSQDFREMNSFYNLPKLDIGDKIKIIWDQRKFTYEVYANEEGEDISQYNADLILYTCKFLKSDIRIFQYAKLIEN